MPSHPLSDLSVLDQYAKAPFAPGYPTDHRLFCDPDDNSHDCLNYVLGAFQSSLVLGMYGLTDSVLLATLCVQVKTGIPCLVVLDSAQYAGATEKANLAPLLALRATQPNLRLSIGTSQLRAIMHDKVLVGDGSIVVTGSTNWSDSGEEKQNNNLIVSISPFDAAKFTAQLEAVYAYQMANCPQP